MNVQNSSPVSARGTLGEVSRIKHHTLEAEEAQTRRDPIKALTELALLVGAVKAWLAKHHDSITLADLERTGDSYVEQPALESRARIGLSA